MTGTYFLKGHTMTRKEKQHAALGYAALAEGNAEQAPQDTINRLRYCFPGLDYESLLAMALKHPNVKRERRYHMRRAYAWRRRLKALEGRGRAEGA
jgi:hypothetical protein